MAFEPSLRLISCWPFNRYRTGQKLACPQQSSNRTVLCRKRLCSAYVESPWRVSSLFSGMPKPWPMKHACLCLQNRDLRRQHKTCESEREAACEADPSNYFEAFCARRQFEMRLINMNEHLYYLPSIIYYLYAFVDTSSIRFWPIRTLRLFFWSSCCKDLDKGRSKACG